jgi:hypothetical protein
MTTHKCPITGCKRDVDEDKLMCAPHWYMVPKPLRKALYGAWRGGNGAGSEAHVAAMRSCIHSVEQRLLEV